MAVTQLFTLRRLALPLAIVAGIAGVPVGAVGATTGEARGPNVIVIMADDVGYGDISSYGAESISTPNIDQLAQDGVRFTNAHSDAATCTPSRFSLITGRYAWRKEDTGIASGSSPLLINPERVTIADVMKRAGYKTAVIGKWHLGLGPKPNGPDWNGVIKPGPLELGFDYSFIIAATPDRVPTVYVKNHRVVGLDPSDPIVVSYKHKVGNRPTGKDDPQDLTMLPSHGHDDTIINGISRIGWMAGGHAAVWKDSTMSKVMTKQAVGFITRNKDRRFFLYFASHDVHVPRVPAARFAGKSGMGPRGDELLELDWEVGRIRQTLKRLHIAENTLIIFTSDNGPVLDDGYQDGAVELAKHPITTPWNKNLLPPATSTNPNPRLPAHEAAGPFSGGKYSILEGGTRVPFIVYWPGHAAKGKVSDALVSQVDLLASFAALTGQHLQSSTGPDSVDILPTLLGKTAQGVDEVVVQTNGRVPLALIRDHWKYIQPDKGPAYQASTDTELGNMPEPQLYDLRSDPGEKHNLARQYPERLADMQHALQEIIDR